MKILVIGCGSIGLRHIGNLKKHGVRDVLAFDADPARSAAAGVRTAGSLDALLKERPDAAVIALPTALHARFALRAARAGCHLFIEKPLSSDMKGLAELSRAVTSRKKVCYLGYNFRFHPTILALRAALKKGAIGAVLGGRTHFGSYLPDRHPGRDYRKGYGARRSLGGGVILDALSHHLDYLNFLLGRPSAGFCYAGRHSRLAINVEDTAEILLRFGPKTVISVHGDFVQRPYKHTIELVGERGTAVCDLFDCSLRLYNTRSRRWKTERQGKDLNTMYLAQMEHFLSCLRKRALPPVGLRGGIEEMKWLVSLKRSAALKRWVAL